MTTLTTVVLLFASNIFMNFAWYGHLKKMEYPLWQAILVSWGIAFFEYVLMVPANRIGFQTLSIFQLKILQEVITISVFVLIAIFYFKEALKWNYLVAFVFIVGAVFFVFYDFKQ
jgi:uncharacterized protein (DUF486 family)